jgi:hypothetical protein
MDLDPRAARSVLLARATLPEVPATAPHDPRVARSVHLALATHLAVRATKRRVTHEIRVRPVPIARTLRVRDASAHEPDQIDRHDLATAHPPR